jgi:hypothetical protein
MQSSGLFVRASFVAVLITAMQVSVWGQSPDGIALTGDVAPGTGGARYASFSPPSINSQGAIAFTAGLSGGTALRGIFKSEKGVIHPIALEGQPVPGMASAAFWSFGQPSINQSGDLAFVATVRSHDTSQNQGVFFRSGALIQKLADQDSEISGKPESKLEYFYSISLNDKGTVVFQASLTTGPLPGGTGIFEVANGIMRALVIGGQVVNGKPLGDIGHDFSLNNLDHISFLSSTEGKNNLFLLAGTTILPVASSGQLVPGSIVKLDLITRPSLNDRDEIVFINQEALISKVTIYRSNAVVSWRGGSLGMIAQIGDSIPGLENATLQGSFLDPYINNSGTASFAARAAISNPSSSYAAIFTVDNGDLYLRIREDHALPGIGKLSFLSSSAINDQGVLAFAAKMENAVAGVFTLTAEVSHLSFPHIADGTSAGTAWKTNIQIANRDMAAAHVTVRFYNDDGSAMTLSIRGQSASQFAFTIPPLGALSIETDGLGSLKTGWGTVTADQSMSGIAIFSFFDTGGELLDAVGTADSSDLQSMALFVTRSTAVDTGIALANPGISKAELTLSLRDSLGNILDTRQYTLQPKAHFAKYLTELFDPALIPQPFQGRIELTSDLPVVAVGLRQQGVRWTSLPIVR